MTLFSSRTDAVVGQITTSHFLRIVHVTPDGTSIYLNAVDGAAELATAAAAGSQTGTRVTELAGAPAEVPAGAAGTAAGAPPAAAGSGDDGAGGPRVVRMPMLLTTDPEEAEVFAVRQVERSRMHDLTYVISALPAFAAFGNVAAHLDAAALRRAAAAATSGHTRLPASAAATRRGGATGTEEVVAFDDGKDVPAPATSADGAASSAVSPILLATSHPLPMRALTRTITALIIFVTKSDNLDPMTREGIALEQRQQILSEQGVLRLAIECVEAVRATWPQTLLFGHRL